MTRKPWQLPESKTIKEKSCSALYLTVLVFHKDETKNMQPSIFRLISDATHIKLVQVAFKHSSSQPRQQSKTKPCSLIKVLNGGQHAAARYFQLAVQYFVVFDPSVFISSRHEPAGKNAIDRCQMLKEKRKRNLPPSKT